MSSTNVVFNNGQQIQSEIDLKKLALFAPIIKTYEHTNSTYDTETFVTGLVCGVNKTTGEIAPYKSTNTDGTEYPCLVLAYGYSVEAGDTIKFAALVRGELRSDMLSFARSGDSLSTLVGNRRVHEVLEDRFILRGITNATKFDNEI